MTASQATPLLDMLIAGTVVEGEATIVTSGYRDRYVSLKNRYVCYLPNRRPIILGSDHAGMFDAILALVTAAGENTDADAVWDRLAAFHAPHRATKARWETFDEHGYAWVTDEVNVKAVEAFLKLHTTSLHDEARERCELESAAMSAKDRQWVIWGLYQCNRSNRQRAAAGLRAGHDVEVHIPGYEWPLDDHGPATATGEPGPRL